MPGRQSSGPPAARPASACASVPLSCPADGMHDEPGGLVDDDQVRVLVGDVELDLVGAALVGRRRNGRGHLDRLAARQQEALLPRPAVDADGTGVDQLDGGSARPDIGMTTESDIEALALDGVDREAHAGASFSFSVSF